MDITHSLVKINQTNIPEAGIQRLSKQLDAPEKSFNQILALFNLNGKIPQKEEAMNLVATGNPEEIDLITLNNWENRKEDLMELESILNIFLSEIKIVNNSTNSDESSNLHSSSKTISLADYTAYNPIQEVTSDFTKELIGWFQNIENKNEPVSIDSDHVIEKLTKLVGALQIKEDQISFDIEDDVVQKIQMTYEEIKSYLDISKTTPKGNIGVLEEQDMPNNLKTNPLTVSDYITNIVEGAQSVKREEIKLNKGEVPEIKIAQTSLNNAESIKSIKSDITTIPSMDNGPKIHIEGTLPIMLDHEQIPQNREISPSGVEVRQTIERTMAISFKKSNSALNGEETVENSVESSQTLGNEEPLPYKIESGQILKSEEPLPSKMESRQILKSEEPLPFKEESGQELKSEEPLPSKEKSGQILKSEETLPSMEESGQILKSEKPLPSMEESGQILKSEKPLPSMEESGQILKSEEPLPFKEESGQILKSEEPLPSKEKSGQPLKSEEPLPSMEESGQVLKSEKPLPFKEESGQELKSEEPLPFKIESGQTQKSEEQLPYKVLDTLTLKSEETISTKVSNKLEKSSVSSLEDTLDFQILNRQPYMVDDISKKKIDREQPIKVAETLQDWLYGRQNRIEGNLSFKTGDRLPMKLEEMVNQSSLESNKNNNKEENPVVSPTLIQPNFDPSLIKESISFSKNLDELPSSKPDTMGAILFQPGMDQDISTKKPQSTPNLALTTIVPEVSEFEGSFLISEDPLPSKVESRQILMNEPLLYKVESGQSQKSEEQLPYKVQDTQTLESEETISNKVDKSQVSSLEDTLEFQMLNRQPYMVDDISKKKLDREQPIMVVDSLQDWLNGRQKRIEGNLSFKTGDRLPMEEMVNHSSHEWNKDRNIKENPVVSPSLIQSNFEPSIIKESISFSNNLDELPSSKLDTVSVPISQSRMDIDIDTKTPQSTSNLTLATFVPQVSEFAGRYVRILNGHIGSTEAKFNLFPEHLGHLEVKIVSQDGQVSVQIVTDSSIAKESLEGQLHQLRQSLQTQGLQVQKLEIVQQMPDSFDSNQAGLSFSQGNSGSSQEQPSYYLTREETKKQSGGEEQELEREHVPLTYGETAPKSATRIDFTA